MAKRAALQPGWFITPADRAMLQGIIPEPKLNMVTYGAKPLVHHYSWVRSREEMLQKVKSWGHNQDRNWVKLVEDHFALSESKRGGAGFRDFVHGYAYRTVRPYISLTDAAA